MKRIYFVYLVPCLVTAFSFSQSIDSKAQVRILDSYGKLPLSFEANRGQTDARVKFLSRTGSYTLFLTGEAAVLALRGTKAKTGSTARILQPDMPEPKVGGVLRMKLRNANAGAKVSGVDELGGKSNYFIGNDPAKWRTNVPTYARVKYEGIYSGIDLVYYGNQHQLDYDFIVAPGADPRRIAFDVAGAKRIRRDAHGDLVFKVGEDEVRWGKPLVYQEKDGVRQLVAARYSLTSRNRVAFEVAKYDASRPLFIDPLVYSTYLGGSALDYGEAIAIDGAGDAYVTGGTESNNFPVTPGAFQTSGNGVFVTKFNPTGSALFYSTYLSGDEWGEGYGIDVDSAGDAYVTGLTGANNFPVTPGAFQTTGAGVFVTKLNPTGSALVYSTYLGSNPNDMGLQIAVDSSGDAYVDGVTYSTAFPVTPGAFQTICHPNSHGVCATAFVTKFNPNGSALVYSTYLGGSGDDYGVSIAVDSVGDAYIGGGTGSTDFPVTPGAFQTACNVDGQGNCNSGFVTKFNPGGSALVYSTYLGGNGDGGVSGIAVDGAGNAYIAGATAAANFPVTQGAFQTTYGGGESDAFVTELNPTGSGLIYSTFLGGSNQDESHAIALDGAGDAYVTGYTNSTDFPITIGAFQTICNHGSNCAKYSDAFVARINPTGSALVYSTYLGGRKSDYGSSIAVDSESDAYVIGSTFSADFPVTPGAFQTICNGGQECGKLDDAFVTKIQMLEATTTTLSSSPNPSAYGEAVTFTSIVASNAGAPPNGETVSFMKGKTALGTGTLSGGTATFTTSKLKVGTTKVAAVYSGDSNFSGSTSKPVKQVVNP